MQPNAYPLGAKIETGKQAEYPYRVDTADVFRPDSSEQNAKYWPMDETTIHTSASIGDRHSAMFSEKEQPSVYYNNLQRESCTAAKLVNRA